MPAIIDLNAEAAKLAAVLKQTPMNSEKRKGAIAKLGTYRDGILLLGTSVGTGAGHWERPIPRTSLYTCSTVPGPLTSCVTRDRPGLMSFALERSRSFRAGRGTVSTVAMSPW